MPETAEQRVELPSDGKQRTEAQAKTEKLEIVDKGWKKESVSNGSHPVSNMTSTREAKVKANDLPRFSFAEPSVTKERQ